MSALIVGFVFLSVCAKALLTFETHSSPHSSAKQTVRLAEEPKLAVEAHDEMTQ